MVHYNSAPLFPTGECLRQRERERETMAYSTERESEVERERGTRGAPSDRALLSLRTLNFF